MKPDTQRAESLLPDLEGGICLALTQLHELLRHFDLEKLKSETGGPSKEHITVVSTLARIGKQALELEKFKEQMRTEREKTEQGKRDGVITSEKLRQVEEALRLL